MNISRIPKTKSWKTPLANSGEIKNTIGMNCRMNCSYRSQKKLKYRSLHTCFWEIYIHETIMPMRRKAEQDLQRKLL